MAWTHCVSDIPMKDWAFFRRMHAVAVDHHVYLFDYNKSCKEDAMQVLIFNPKTHAFRVIQPAGRREGSSNEATASKGEMVLIHFAVAYQQKVYVCLGGRTTSTGGELSVFDTRTLRWSCVRTSGDAPAGAARWRVCACEEDGHLYAWAASATGVNNEESCIWALEMSTLQWNIVATGEWSGRCIPRCIVPYKNRIYVLLERLELPLDCTDDEVTYFDLATKTWVKPQPPGTSPLAMQLWIPFVYKGHLYVFLNEKRMNDCDLRKRFGNVNLDKVVLRYSFAENYWQLMWFKGVTPKGTLNLVCVVDNMAVFFALSSKKAYVLDFFPSLRSLCFQVVSKYHLDSTLLPTLLKRELSMYNYHYDDLK